jgi:SEC-C motif-containing protein
MLVFDAIDRLDSCPCGSGRQFKRCHGAGDDMRVRETRKELG